MIRTRIVCAAVAALGLLSAPAAQAQSALSARGLGYPLEGLDARARGLGGVTTGLPEPHLSLVNPAAVAGLPAAGISVTFQGDEISSNTPGRDQTYSTARFPAIQLAFPVGQRFVGLLGYASVLDHNWTANTTDSMFFAGEMREVRDVFRAEGGLARFRVSGGYRLAPRLDVGAGLDVYTGAVRDSSLRVISGLTNVALQGTDHTWNGIGFSVGARWRGDAMSVSAALSGGGKLKASTPDSGGISKSYSLPLVLDAGASARISQNALAVASMRYGGWGAMNDELTSGVSPGEGAGTGGGSQDVLQVTGGLEYEGLRFLGRPLPVRLGGRYTQLPFRWSPSAEFPDEKAVTGGMGMLFAGGAAVLELGAERGWRGGDAAQVDEGFWRLSLTMSLLGR